MRRSCECEKKVIRCVTHIYIVHCTLYIYICINVYLHIYINNYNNSSYYNIIYIQYDIPLFIEYSHILEDNQYFHLMIQEMNGSRDFDHTEEKLTKVCQTVTVWCLKDFLRCKK